MAERLPVGQLSQLLLSPKHLDRMASQNAKAKVSTFKAEATTFKAKSIKI